MLNFSYSFNRAKRRSRDANESSYPHSPKNVFHRRSDSIDHGYFPKNAEYQRRSEGSDTLNSDFREDSTYSYPGSPTGFKRCSNTANTSIVSQPVIDLNNVLKETSKFKRSLSYPLQNTQNRRNTGEYSLNGYPIGGNIPTYSSNLRNNEYAYILSGDDTDLVINQDGYPPHESNAISQNDHEYYEKSKENEDDQVDYDIDEVLFTGQLTHGKDAATRPRTTTKIRILPKASEELLSRLQLKNAGIAEVAYKSKNGKEDDEDEDEEEEKSDTDVKDRDRDIKNGRKKKTFISKTISRLNPGL